MRTLDLRRSTTALVILHHTVHHQSNTLSINVCECSEPTLGATGVDIDGVTAAEFGAPAATELSSFITNERLVAFVKSLPGAPDTVTVGELAP
jgi:hypothetical protein